MEEKCEEGFGSVPSVAGNGPLWHSVFTRVLILSLMLRLYDEVVITTLMIREEHGVSDGDDGDGGSASDAWWWRW